MLRVAVAPCSPFSVTAELLREAAALARRRGVLLHTHLAETLDEEKYCRERFGCTPVEYMESLGWLGPDVWFAHAVHLDDEAVAQDRRHRHRGGALPVLQRPSRLGHRPRPRRCATPAPASGSVSTAPRATSRPACSRRRATPCCSPGPRGGPQALSVRDALEMATLGGAAVLGRSADLGSLEPGKLADLALWRLDTFAHADIDDPVAALVLGARPPLELLLVDGRTVVEHDRVVTVDERDLAREAVSVHRSLLSSTR